MKHRSLPTSAFTLAMILAVAAGVTGVSGASQTSARTFEIAEITTLSGANGFYGQAQLKGAELYADQVNASGGIPKGTYKGDKIKIVSFDDQYQTNLAALAAQKAVDNSDIWAVEGFIISDNAVAAKPILERAGIPLLSTGASAAVITEDAKNVFIDIAPNSSFANGAALVSQKIGAKKVGIIQISGALGDSLATLGAAEYKKLGIPVTSDQQIPLDTTNVQAQLLKAKSQGDNTIYAVGYNTELGAVVNGLASLNWHPIIVDPNGTGGSSEFDQLVGAKGNGMVGAGNLEPNSPKFIAAFKAKYGSKDLAANVGGALGSYQTTAMIVAGLDKGPKTRADLGPLLYHLQVPEQGVATLRYDNQGNAVGQYLYFYQLENGKATIKWLYNGTKLTNYKAS